MSVKERIVQIKINTPFLGRLYLFPCTRYAASVLNRPNYSPGPMVWAIVVTLVVISKA